MNPLRQLLRKFCCPKASSKRMLLALVLVFGISLSCKLPLDILSPSSPEEKLEENLMAEGLLNIDEIHISDNQVTIKSAMLLEEDPEVMVSSWLTAIDQAAEAVPEATEIILLITSLGDPVLEITAESSDVKSFREGGLSLEEYLGALHMLEFRSLESRVMSLLIEMGYDVRAVSQVDQTLIIDYHPAPSDDMAALMEEWVLIFGSVAEIDPLIGMIQIRTAMLDTSIFVVETSGVDLAAYAAGELTPFQYLARLVISEEPVQLDSE